MNRSLLLTSILFTALSCNTSPQKVEETHPVLPSRPLKAAFLIVNGVYNSELVAPMDVLQHTVFHTENGIEVFTVAPTKDPITTFEGLRILPDYGFNYDSIPVIDILIVPSAQHSMDTDLDDTALINFVYEKGRSAMYFMSLCDGAFVLAKAGLLDGLECTTFPTDVERFRKTFPQLSVHEGISFVNDGKAITSAGGAKSYDPAMYLVELLYGKDVATGIGKGLVIDWDVTTIEHKVFYE